MDRARQRGGRPDRTASHDLTRFASTLCATRRTNAWLEGPRRRRLIRRALVDAAGNGNDGRRLECAGSPVPLLYTRDQAALANSAVHRVQFRERSDRGHASGHAQMWQSVDDCMSTRPPPPPPAGHPSRRYGHPSSRFCVAGAGAVGPSVFRRVLKNYGRRRRASSSPSGAFCPR